MFPGIKIPSWLWQAAGLVLVIGGYSWWMYDLGRDHKQAEWNAAVVRGREVVASLQARQGSISISGDIVYKEKLKIVKEKGDVIQKEIPVYVPVNLPDLPGSFRVWYDAAAANAIPSAAGIPDAAPVPVATLAGSIGRNFNQCYQEQQQLIALQRWVRDQREAYLSECKQQGLSCSTGN